jgi:hypothetical protein
MDGILDYLRRMGIIGSDAGPADANAPITRPGMDAMSRMPPVSTVSSAPTPLSSRIPDIVANSGDFTYDASKAAGRGMPISPASSPAPLSPQPTTTGRVMRPISPAPTQAQTPSQMYYLDRGDGSPVVPMGNQLPKGMSPGSQQGGGYIFGVAPPTKSLFGGNQQQQPSNVPTPPPRPANLGAAPQQQPQRNMDYGDRTPPLAVRQQQQQQSITPQDDSGFRQMALVRNKELVDMGLSGDKAGGRINHAHKIAKGKATPCHSGIINMAVGGRTDHIPMNVLEGSYVLPADIVSGLGEGNTLAGSKILDNMFQSAPFGTKIPTARANLKIPALSFSKTTQPQASAHGGRTYNMNSKPVPIIAAGGEYVVHPDVVSKLGNGNMDEGHEYLDNFVKYVRAHTAKTLQNLPGPRKD